MNESDLNETWNEDYENFWKPLLLTEGKFDPDKIKAEMHDLVFVQAQVAEVYDHITGGTLSKCMYYADVIKNFHDDAVNEPSHKLEIAITLLTAVCDRLESMIEKECDTFDGTECDVELCNYRRPCDMLAETRRQLEELK